MAVRKTRDASNNYIRTIILLALSIGALTLLSVGCEEYAVVSEGDSGDSVNFFDVVYNRDALSTRPDVSDIQSSSFESRLSADKGGMLPLHDAAEIQSFVVLPASIPSDTTFSAEVLKIKTVDRKTVMVYEFGPDGLVFSRPAVLRLNLREILGIGASSIKFYGLNEDTAEWVYLGTYDSDTQNIVNVPINHFSVYAGSGDGSDHEKDGQK
ncbi:MAG: hypothetical protein JSV52_09350 [Candidatus Zixiibacteriota bacterium]|nr:MAG: hypothetical protein JSV52_09350 [candidate division Zixibacteria bacterium]